MASHEQDKCVQNYSNDNPKHDKASTIRRLNDSFRRTGIGGKLFITPGIMDQGEEALGIIVMKVQLFDAFTQDNDPYCEHDMGGFTHQGLKIFWKIDYYDNDLHFGSPDPADATVTTRLLTIMLASEY